MTAGNASGVNDGAAAMIIASEAAVKAHGLTPRARIPAWRRPACRRASWASARRRATEKLMSRLGCEIADFDVIELNEAFAAQGARRDCAMLGLPDDSEVVNPNGGAIALGHPLGMSGTRLVITAINQLETTKAEKASPPCASASARVSASQWSERERKLFVVRPHEGLTPRPKKV